jgi:parallel beta-helix repeat protein
VILTNNTVNNAENAIEVRNASGITLTSNTLLLSRKNSVSVSQDISGATDTVTMNGNTLLQRNVDYPYIEMRDETPGP